MSCGCSIRTPMAKGFCSKAKPFSYSMVKVSLALCPNASTTSEASRRSFPLISTPVTMPFSEKISVTLEKKRTSPPKDMIFCRISFTTPRSKSVPMWGLLSYKISFGAPAATNSSSTFRHLGSLMRVVSFPSENVPAPPSPNWTLLSTSSTPVCQNLSTASFRLSTSPPRSSTMGFKPICAKRSAANIPAGPKPTTTGRFSI